MKKYSKKVREEAALICALAASSHGWGSDTWGYGELRRLASASLDALILAWGAWMTLSSHYESTDRARDAEAEALIRTGWSP